MFVKEILGEIIEISNEKLDNDFIEAKEKLVRGFDHKFYYISQTKTDEYKLAEKEYLYNQELKLLRDKVPSVSGISIESK